MNVSHVMVSSKYPRTKQGIRTTMVFGQSMSWTLEILQTSHGAPILVPSYMLAKCWTAARGLISTWIAAMLLPGGNQRRSGWRWYSVWSLVMDLGGGLRASQSSSLMNVPAINPLIRKCMRAFWFFIETLGVFSLLGVSARKITFLRYTHV